MIEMDANRTARAEIRAEMARQQITQVALAERMGWGGRYLGRRLRGETPLSLGDLEAIARALDVPMAQFTDTRPRFQAV